MPLVTREELAQLRGDLGETIADGGSQLVSIWRAPLMAGGKRGDVDEIATDVPMKIWPGTGAGAQAVLMALGDLSGSRIIAVGFVQIGVGLQIGDEIHTASRTYKVAGAGPWNATTAAALSEVQPR